MAFDQNTFGENIRFQRMKKDLSIEELAEMIDISSSFMGLVERGQRGLSLEKIVKLLSVLGIKFEDLLKKPEPFLQEEKADHKSVKKAKVDTIISLLSNLNELELNYVIDVIKSFKQYVKKLKAAGNEDKKENA